MITKALFCVTGVIVEVLALLVISQGYAIVGVALMAVGFSLVNVAGGNESC